MLDQMFLIIIAAAASMMVQTVSQADLGMSHTQARRWRKKIEAEMLFVLGGEKG